MISSKVKSLYSDRVGIYYSPPETQPVGLPGQCSAVLSCFLLSSARRGRFVLFNIVNRRQGGGKVVAERLLHISSLLAHNRNVGCVCSLFRCIGLYVCLDLCLCVCACVCVCVCV